MGEYVVANFLNPALVRGFFLPNFIRVIGCIVYTFGAIIQKRLKFSLLYRLNIVCLMLGVEPCSASITDTIVNKDSLIEFWHIHGNGPIQNNSRILDLELDGFQIYNPINLPAAPKFNKWNSW